MGPRAGLDGGGKSRPHRDLIPGPARSESLYRLSYPGRTTGYNYTVGNILQHVSTCIGHLQVLFYS